MKFFPSQWQKSAVTNYFVVLDFSYENKPKWQAAAMENLISFKGNFGWHPAGVTSILFILEKEAESQRFVGPSQALGQVRQSGLDEAHVCLHSGWYSEPQISGII